MTRIFPAPETATVLVDASNLRSGGGVQVAASLVDEIIELESDPTSRARHPWLASVSYEVSSEVAANLVGNHVARVNISNSKWFQLAKWIPRIHRKYDLQLTVFGPRYGSKRGTDTIVGLADVTSVYRRPEGVAPGSVANRLKQRIRGVVSRHIFRHESFLVSESASLASLFSERTGYPNARIQVIPNVISQTVKDPSLQQPLNINLRMAAGSEALLFAYPARYYAHKNHQILPEIRRILVELGIDVRFVVTLTNEEWESVDAITKESCINVGVIAVNQLADLYQQCDAAIFPSLLESFSVTPLEALHMNGLLFASDRSFVRDVCGDAAVYIDPLNPAKSAETIMKALSNPDTIAQYRHRAADFVQLQKDSRSRAAAYVELISNTLSMGPAVE